VNTISTPFFFLRGVVEPCSVMVDYRFRRTVLPPS